MTTSATPTNEYVLANARTGGRLAVRLQVARAGWRGLFRILGRRWLDRGEGRRYLSEAAPRRPDRLPVDVLFVDRDGIVLYALAALPSFQAMRSEGVHSVVELPAGTIAASGTAPGDRLEMLRTMAEALAAEPGAVDSETGGA
ncbi:MAG: DUF192 domain-containing protein [Dehalococcoidia bacterium]